MSRMSKKNPPAPLVLPRDYGPILLVDEKAEICRDFFPTLCPSQLDLDWAALTVKYAPYFTKSAVSPATRVVNANHVSGKNTPVSRTNWLRLVQEEVFAKRFRHTMTMGWNTGLAELMEKQWASADGGVDFSFRGQTPTTQEDVKKILFGEEVTRMVKSGCLAEPMALLFKWGYYLTMEGCKSEWTEKAVSGYIKAMGYNIVLGDGCKMKKEMTVHVMVRIARKMAINSFQTNLRRNQEKVWGFRLLTGSLLEKSEDGQITEVVDIKDYLPEEVLKNMTRKDKTRFKVLRYASGVLNENEMLVRKIEEMVHWSKEKGIAQSMVWHRVRCSLERNYSTTLSTDETTANEGQCEYNVDDALGIEGQMTDIQGACLLPLMAPPMAMELQSGVKKNGSVTLGVTNKAARKKKTKITRTLKVVVPAEETPSTARASTSTAETNRKINALLENSEKV